MFATLLMVAIFSAFAQGVFLPNLYNQDLCGGWALYKNEKCFKIAEEAGFQTQEDAEIICKTFSDDAPSKLITIKSEEEQEFLQRFLFTENEMVDNVWLGLKKKKASDSFKWNDGSEVDFSNWDSQSSSDEQHECVHMESGDGPIKAGLWVRVSCKRKNAVVCERTPTLTLDVLQNMILDLKLKDEIKQKEWELKFAESKSEQDVKQKEWEQKFADLVKEHNEKQKELEERFSKTQEEVAVLKKNPVPVGFVYVQLANQDPPTTLWPLTTWKDISPTYAGLFFRVLGGKAGGFGQTQAEDSPRLAEVKNMHGGEGVRDLTVPHDGSWSGFVYTGSNSGNSFFIQFRISKDEVRPRNQAVKLWQRTQ